MSSVKKISIEQYKSEFYLLNSLIASKDIENEFKEIFLKYPLIRDALNLLIIIREYSNFYHINDQIRTSLNQYYQMEQYTLFMQNSGLFHLLSEHLINNLYDYLNANIALISMNTNHFLKSSLMEDFTESYLIKAGLILNLSYFKNSSLNDYFYQKDKLEKYIDYHQKFDFIFKGAFDEIYLCDVCFASSFNEVINNKIKKMMSFSSKIKNRENIHIILITDEISSTYKSYFPDELSNFNLYNCNDLSHGLINTLVNPLNQIEAILSKIKFD